MRFTLSRTAALVAAFLSLSSFAGAQGSDELINSLPLWQKDRSITTSIKDVLPVVNNIQVRPEWAMDIPSDFVMGPGYYRSVICSYCLHAGTYGPTKGDGYLIAPLKGDRAGVIRNILLRSPNFLNIEQSDIQRLIWGIEDCAKWDSYSADFRAKVSPLMTPTEIALLNVEPQQAEIGNVVKDKIGGLIPGGARKAVDSLAELRNRITTLSDFSELEKIAVKTGVAPWGKDSRKDVQPGSWSYVGDGFYLRTFPTNYSTTTMEILRIGVANITKDDKGRITKFESDGRVIETSYDDMPGTETVAGKVEKVWRFKKVVFRHPDGRTHEIVGKGYVVAPPTLSNSSFYAFLSPQDDGSLGSIKHYEDGMSAATDPEDMKGKWEWIKDHLNRVSAAWDAASAALSGVTDADATPKKFDPSKWVSTPANTNKQRLASSSRKK